MKILLCLAAIAAIALSAPADVNVSGKWSGTFSVTGSDGNSEPAFLLLKQEGTTVTGSAGPNESQQHPIKKGSVAGNKLTLEIEPRENQSIKLEPVVDGDQMKGEINMARDGETRSGKLEVARAK